MREALYGRTPRPVLVLVQPLPEAIEPRPSPETTPSMKKLWRSAMPRFARAAVAAVAAIWNSRALRMWMP
ncbi:MAG: hypothetical protein ABUS79_24240 [Pseudomonadota bacterium]